MTCGVLLFAHNNEAIDYAGMAVLCATHVKRHLGVPVALVTDTTTKTDIPDGIFDTIQVVDINKSPQRHYNIDGKTGQYHNKSRRLAHQLSPYDETLVMDTDYLVQTDELNQVWGSNIPFMMNHRVSGIYGDKIKPTTHTMSYNTIPLYWATVFYFTKCAENDVLFALVDYVITHYNYFSHRFGYSTHLFRMDFVYSVVNHLMSGNTGAHMFADLPTPSIVTAWDSDELLYITDTGSVFRVSETDGQPVPCKVASDVHVMDKLGLCNFIRESKS